MAGGWELGGGVALYLMHTHIESTQKPNIDRVDIDTPKNMANVLPSPTMQRHTHMA